MLQFLLRTEHAALFVAHIKLDDFLASHAACVLHGYGEGQRTLSLHLFGREDGLAILKGGVAQTMTEGEESGNLLCVVPTIAHEDVFLVLLLDAIAGVGHLVKGMCGTIRQLRGEGERQLATGTNRTAHHVGQGPSSHRTEIPALHDGGHLVYPRHFHGIAGEEHQYQVGIDGLDLFDQLVLAERQSIFQAVATLAILEVVLVQATDHNDQVGFLGLGHGLGTQGIHHILGNLVDLPVHGTTGSIAPGILHLVAIQLAQAVQRGYHVLHFQLGGTAALVQQAHGIVAHHEDTLILRGVDGQQGVALLHHGRILQQDDAFVTNLSGGGIMLVRADGTIRLVAVHGRAEDKAQDACGLVVDSRHGHFALFQHLQVGIGQEIVVVTKGTFRSQAVGVRTHLDIQSVDGSLVGVVRTAPVGNDHAVKTPVALQNLLEQQLMVAAVLAAEFIIRPHDGPCAPLLHGSLEGGQVEFVEGTVAGLHVDVSAPQFLIVQGKMFHADGHAVLLHLLDVGHAHHAGQIGVFAHILEITAIQRRTVDVDAGTEQHVLLAVNGFLADGFTILGGHLGIPRSCQTGQGRKSGDAVVGLVGVAPVVPIDFGTHAVRAVAPPQFGNAEAGHT